MNNNKNNMSNNYKIVNVYLSYGENSISKIDIIKSEFGVDDVVYGVFREMDIKFKDDDELYYGIKKIDEKNDIGVIGYGDEEIILVIGDKNKWYNKVDKYKEINIVDEGVDGDDYDEWVEFVEGLVDSIV